MYTPIRDFYLVSPQNRKSSANTNTIKMDEEDAERDRLLSVMFYMVSNGLKASKAAVKAAAQQLDVVLRPYKGAQGAADDAETSLIPGFTKGRKHGGGHDAGVGCYGRRAGRSQQQLRRG